MKVGDPRKICGVLSREAQEQSYGSKALRYDRRACLAA